MIGQRERLYLCGITLYLLISTQCFFWGVGGRNDVFASSVCTYACILQEYQINATGRFHVQMSTKYYVSGGVKIQQENVCVYAAKAGGLSDER